MGDNSNSTTARCPRCTAVVCSEDLREGWCMTCGYNAKYESQLATMRGALEKYGDHEIDCEMGMTDRDKDSLCDCGLDRALSGEAAREEKEDG